MAEALAEVDRRARRENYPLLIDGEAVETPGR